MAAPPFFVVGYWLLSGLLGGIPLGIHDSVEFISLQTPVKFSPRIPLKLHAVPSVRLAHAVIASFGGAGGVEPSGGCGGLSEAMAENEMQKSANMIVMSDNFIFFSLKIS